MVRGYGGCVRLGLGSDLKTCSGNFDLLSGLPIIDFVVGQVMSRGCDSYWNGGMAAVWCLLYRFPPFRKGRVKDGAPRFPCDLNFGYEWVGHPL